MSALAASLPAYLYAAGMSVRTVYAYRGETAFILLSTLLRILLLAAVWSAVYAGRTSVDGVDLATLLTFLTISNLQIGILSGDVGYDLQRRVREGQIALDLARPIPLLGQMLARQIGITAGLLPFYVVAFPFAGAVGALQPPASAMAALLYVVSLVLAYLITVLIALLLGLVSFWTLETQGIWAIYRFVRLFFAGALVPLWFFPPALRLAAELLPFQTQAFLPVSIYVGRLVGADALAGLGVQVFWLLALSALARQAWRGAIHRVVVQGG